MIDRGYSVAQFGSGDDSQIRKMACEHKAPPRLTGRLRVPISLSLGFIALCIFVSICLSVGSQGWLANFDAELSEALHRSGQSSPITVHVFHEITQLGAVPVLGAIGLVVAGILAWFRRYAVLVIWSTAVLGAATLSMTLKYAFQRLRPTFPDPFVIEVTPSFPSGHALGAIVCYGLLAYLLVLRTSHLAYRIAVLCGTTVLILAIGFSRLYLGAHYFSDVAGGYAVGCAWLAAAISLAEAIRNRRLGKPEKGLPMEL